MTINCIIKTCFLGPGGYGGGSGGGGGGGGNDKVFSKNGGGIGSRTNGVHILIVQVELAA